MSQSWQDSLLVWAPNQTELHTQLPGQMEPLLLLCRYRATVQALHANGTVSGTSGQTTEIPWNSGQVHLFSGLKAVYSNEQAYRLPCLPQGVGLQTRPLWWQDLFGELIMQTCATHSGQTVSLAWLCMQVDTATSWTLKRFWAKQYSRCSDQASWSDEARNYPQQWVELWVNSPSPGRVAKSALSLAKLFEVLIQAKP